MKLYIFDNLMKLYGKLGLPCQSPNERMLIKKWLLEQAQKNGSLTVFEYGTGYSTLYYTNFLNKKEIIYFWETIDNSKEWSNRIFDLYLKRMKFNIIDWLIRGKSNFGSVNFWFQQFKPFFEMQSCGSPRLEEEFNYIQWPVGKKYDVIFIDGRFRRRCLEISGECLNPGGIIILHDAHRKHYIPGLKCFRGEFYKTGKYFPGQKQNPEWLIWKGHQ